MKLKLIRTFLGKKYTIGHLYVNGQYFCDTLENPNRDLNKNGKFDNGEKKEYGNTCIPYGIYKVILSISAKFKRLLPRLLHVNSFTGILIHIGNTVEDTAGCILVGKNNKKGRVSYSTATLEALMKVLKEAQQRNEEITIEIV